MSHSYSWTNERQNNNITRHIAFDSKGRRVTGDRTFDWQIEFKERDRLIPDIKIVHYHNGEQHRKTSRSYHGSAVLLNTTLCNDCGEKMPMHIIEDGIKIIQAEKPMMYGAIAVPDGRMRGLKSLADGWLLSSNKSQKEQSLFHLCAPNHPASLFYGRGIPLSQLTLPPRANCCKTCSRDIPKGVLMALLITRSKIKL